MVIRKITSDAVQPALLPAQNRGRGDLGFEATLWLAADKLRGNLDAAEYKHVVLGLIFLKYISDAFEEKRNALAAEPGADPEDRDEYTAENVFWVPNEARWSRLQAEAKQPTIGRTLDDAGAANCCGRHQSRPRIGRICGDCSRWPRAASCSPQSRSSFLKRRVIDTRC